MKVCQVIKKRPSDFKGYYVGFTHMNAPSSPLFFPSMCQNIQWAPGAISVLPSTYIHTPKQNKKYDSPFFNVGFQTCKPLLNPSFISSFFCYIFFSFAVLLVPHFRFTLPLVKILKVKTELSRCVSVLDYYTGATWQLCSGRPAPCVEKKGSF